jgi:hypothetical protein
MRIMKGPVEMNESAAKGIALGIGGDSHLASSWSDRGVG